MATLQQRLAAKPVVTEETAELQKLVLQQKTALSNLQQQLISVQRQNEDRGLTSEVLRTPTLSSGSSTDMDSTGLSTPPMLTRLSTGKLNSSLPPPRPPPSASLPPLPLGAVELPTDPRSSIASTIGRQGDTLTTRASTTSFSTVDSLALDGKWPKDSQDALVGRIILLLCSMLSAAVQIAKMTQQLAHCEKDLK